MAYDVERFGAIVSDIQTYFTDLESLGIKDVADLEDKKSFYSASMIAFSIINRAIDLGNEIISAEGFGTPATYKDIFSILRKERVFDKDLEMKLSRLVGYRNLPSHEYHGLTEKDVFDVCRRIDVVKALVTKAKARIGKS